MLLNCRMPSANLGIVNTKDEGTAGYIFSNQEPHSVPLYRLYNGNIGDHFYTTNAAERDNAPQHLGYNYEGITGYVLLMSLYES